MTTTADDQNLACLVHAYAEVDLPAVAAGEVPFGNCLVMSPAVVEVLRRLGTEARAAAVHVAFLDLEDETVVSTDPAIDGPQHGRDAWCRPEASWQRACSDLDAGQAG